MKKRRITSKLIAITLSVLLMLTLLPSNAFAVETEATTNISSGITKSDVAAGAASIQDLYGEDYVIDIPDAPLSVDMLSEQVLAVPDVIGLEVAQERNHVARVYAEEGNDLNTIVFANADGTLTRYYFDYPVKYVDNNGEIKDISLEVSADKNNLGTFKSFESEINTSFSKSLADGISLSYDDVSITLIPLSNTLKAQSNLSAMECVKIMKLVLNATQTHNTVNFVV